MSKRTAICGILILSNEVENYHYFFKTSKFKEKKLQMRSVSVRINSVMAWVSLISGIFILLASLYTQQGLSILNGCLFVVLGFLFLTQPLLVIFPNEIQVKNPFGMTVEHYSFYTARDIIIEGGTIYVLQEGKRKKVKGFKQSFLNSTDWKHMVKTIREWQNNLD